MATHFEEAHRRAHDAICKLIPLLKSCNLPLSRQHPHSPKNIWLNHFCPVIDHLMSLGQSCWLPALSLSILCIDAAYQDSKGARLDPPYTKAMLHWIFDPEAQYQQNSGLEKAIKLLAKGLANGLKHDTLVRYPIVLHNPSYDLNVYGEPTFTVHLNNLPVFVSYRDIHKRERLVVFPETWWRTVRDRLNDYYKLQ